MQARKIIPDPSNPSMVYYSPKGDFRGVPAPSRTGEVEPETRPDTFADPQQLLPLNDIGHTRSKGHLHGFDGGWHTQFEYDAGFIAAPQNYKSEEFWGSFPEKPHQQQMLYCGNPIMPVPSGPRRFRRREAEDVKAISQSVFVRGFLVPPQQVQGQIESRYWSKKGDSGRGGTMKNWIKRMASSFMGDNVKDEVIWLPKGELFNDNTRITDSAQAMQCWNEALNPSRSNSALGNLRVHPPSGHQD